MTPITDNRQTPIDPVHINTDQHFFNSVWKRVEPEISARVIVKYCQKQKSWKPFPKSELDKFWNENVWFNGLDQGTDPYIIVKDGIITVTVEFVAACYACSPKINS